jgi:hypothetical protein
MAHDDGYPVIVLGNRHDAFPKSELPAGKSKGVYLLTLKHVKVPLIVRSVRQGDDALPNPPKLRLPVRAPGTGSLLSTSR